MRITLAVGLVLWGQIAATARAQDSAPPLAPGVRGLITRASGQILMDGKLREWTEAFCTPVHYNHANLLNRASQVFYLWDEKALFIGLRCLDQLPGNVGTKGSLWNGDAVEFYLDTRPGAALRGKDWTRGAVHLFYTPFEGTSLKPRWEIRGGIATSDTVLDGVEIAASVEEWGYEAEFKIPWNNFPEFVPRLGSVLALDVELCSGEGGARTDRTFSYGSPLSVQQPASQGKVQLAKFFDPAYLPKVGPSSFPMWVDTPWVQSERAQVRATVAIPPAFVDIAGQIEVRLHDADGVIVKTVPAALEPFGPNGLGFERAVATWSIDDYPPNAYFATAKIKARTGKTITTVAPRMNQEAQMTGR